MGRKEQEAIQVPPPHSKLNKKIFMKELIYKYLFPFNY